jgi:hypothetical protein
VKLNSQGVIDVTIENTKYSNDMPNTKLDILETFLPKDLRNANKFKHQMHEKIRAAHATENNQQNATNRISQMMRADHIVSEDYRPVHYSSGAVSITPSTTYDLPAVNNRGSKNSNRPNLWGQSGVDGVNDSIIAREERNNMQTFMDDLARSLKEHQDAEAKKQQDEREIILKLKVVNTLFNQKVTFEDALIAAAKRAALDPSERDSEVEKERQMEEFKQQQVAEQDAIMDAITRSMELQATNNLVFKTEDFLVESDDSDDEVSCNNMTMHILFDVALYLFFYLYLSSTKKGSMSLHLPKAASTTSATSVNFEND